MAKQRRRRQPATDPGLDPVLGEIGPGVVNDGPVSVVRNASGSVFFAPGVIPTAARALSEDQREQLAALQHLTSELHSLQAHVLEHVEDARAVGLSWHLIGWSLGTTGEAARQRFGGGGRR